MGRILIGWAIGAIVALIIGANMLEGSLLGGFLLGAGCSTAGMIIAMSIKRSDDD
jgi:hypothetical protein